jgi:hypothetical protein
MIETISRFKTKHKFTKELQRDLEERVYRREPIPDVVTVPDHIFKVMQSEVGGSGTSLRLALSLDHQFNPYWNPYSLITPTFHMVRVEPEAA